MAAEIHAMAEEIQAMAAEIAEKAVPAEPRRPMISIITPCYNEEANVDRCAAEVARVMRGELPDYDYEHIFCDNASTDTTVARLRDLAASDPHIKVIVNSRNIGPFRNVANGMKAVSGDFVIPMIPADIQDPPSVVPQMVAKMTEQTDVVYGIRQHRKDPFHIAIARSAYYRLLRASHGTTAPPHSGEFMLVRKEFVQAINAMDDSYPYIRGLVAQMNPRSDTVPYAWGERVGGRSRNSMSDLFDQGLNGIVTTARTPVRWAMLLGIIGALAGIVAAIVDGVVFLFGDEKVLQGIPTLIVGMFLFGGVQLFFLGLIGEYVVSIHSSVRPGPPMIERERINF
ncbi:glycosyltransferase [Cellulomonas sp. NTE-D12]|uniref:glycosyltransferase family 2 protein n=1 Tax=Cellulomonas sp. NTE-D12 TaxID=2962632 RepID=UPI003081891C|nr:glycosyl hydrolase [Cellulomonas sp. NTE-D12]